MPLLLVSGGPWLFDECDLLSAVCTTLKVPLCRRLLPISISIPLSITIVLSLSHTL
jgi:hypothetical protein